MTARVPTLGEERSPARMEGGAYTLVEPCAGSAAFALHLLGARAAPMPYQGSKWRLRRHLQGLAERLGFAGRPDRLVLTDPGPWGRVLPVLLDRRRLRLLVERLRAAAREDPADVFRRLQGGVVPLDDVDFAAEYLFLQRLAFSGKAVGVRDGRWASPGFNRTSAYGAAATDRFGSVHPMVPALVRVLDGYVSQVCSVAVEASCEPARAPIGRVKRTLVYLDPPYVGSTRYPNGQLTGQQVVQLAEAWRHAGAAVIVSERNGLDIPGWTRTRIDCGHGASPFRGQHEEWVTFAAGS